MYAYIYSRKRYKRVLLGLWIAWAVLFTIRVILYINLGPEALMLSINRIMAVTGSGCAGAIITMMVIRRRSSPVPRKAE